MPFNNVKLNYARLYGKELILREIVAEYKSRRWVWSTVVRRPEKSFWKAFLYDRPTIASY